VNARSQDSGAGNGVIVWQGRLLVYQRQGSGWLLRFLGEDGFLAPTPELLAAVERDIRHQQDKRGAE
jgi:hypothetical protein